MAMKKQPVEVSTIRELSARELDCVAGSGVISITDSLWLSVGGDEIGFEPAILPGLVEPGGSFTHLEAHSWSYSSVNGNTSATQQHFVSSSTA
jgi:hypothetical protein